MEVRPSAKLNRIGVSFVQLAFEHLGYIFREQPVSDYGIDAHVEIVRDAKATGQLIALQIKSGPSWFEEKSENGIFFRGDLEHLQYWLDHSLPVVVVLYSPDDEIAYWQVVNTDTIIVMGKGWKLEVPFDQKVDEASKFAFESLPGEPATVTDVYSILALRDVSHAGAKRYSANVLVSETSSNDDIVQTIHHVTQDLRHSEYYRSEQVRRHWEGKPAHVVFLFLYRTLEDVRTTNWVCRSLWIDKTLSPQFAPPHLQGEDVGKDIVVDWSSSYEQMRRLLQQFSLTKETYLAQLDAVLKPVTKEIEHAIQLTDRYEACKLARHEYLRAMSGLEPVVTRLYFQATDIGLPPLECQDLDTRFQGLVADAHNVVLPFSERGLRTWKEQNRRYLVRRAIEDYRRDKARLEFELEKIH